MAESIRKSLRLTVLVSLIALGACLAFAGQAHAAQGLSAGETTSGTLSAQVVSYNVYVGGRQVTSANANDVLGDGGSVKYSASSQTLTLKNAKIRSGRLSGSNSEVLESISFKLSGTFTIKLSGKNTIYAPKTYNSPMYAYGIADWSSNSAKLKIAGSGSLTVHAADASYNSQAIAVWKGMVVQGSAKLYCYGGKSTQKSTGIEAIGGLTVKGSSKIVASGETGAFTKAPKFSGYTPKVKAGYSSKNIKVNKKKPKKTVYTKYAYVKITKAAGTTKKTSSKSSKAPGKVTIRKVTPDSGRFWIYWNKVNKASGYELQVCTSKSFPKNRTYTMVWKGQISSSYGYSYISGLANGQKYYLRMRAYSTSGGKNYYGAWTSVKSVTPRSSSGMA